MKNSTTDDEIELQEIINMLKGRRRIDASYDYARIEGSLPTVVLIEDALKKIGGPGMKEEVRYWSQVCQAAGLEGNVGDWENAPQRTAKAYERMRRALLTTTNKDEVLGLLQIRVPLASKLAE